MLKSIVMLKNNTHTGADIHCRKKERKNFHYYLNCKTQCLLTNTVILIVSVTNFLTMIGSQPAYLSCNYQHNNVGVQLQVSNYNFLYYLLELDTHVNHTSIMCTLMAFFSIFPTVFLDCGECYCLLCSNEIVIRLCQF